MEKVKMMLQKGLILCLILSIGNTAAAGNEPEALLREASRLLQERKDQEALAVYEKVIGLAPQQAEALSQASLLHALLGSRSADESSRYQHYKTAEEYASKAILYAPVSAEANYAMASAYMHQCQIASVRQKLLLLREMKQYLDLALEKNPGYAGAWHLLGRWHFRAANYNLSEMLVTSVMMRGVAKEASNEAAIMAMRKAIELDPDNILYYHDLGRILAENKQPEACQTVLQQALSLDLITAEDLEISRKCKAMLRNLKIGST
jgi:tetratricopeptide (TPR) repeat protein